MLFIVMLVISGMFIGASAAGVVPFGLVAWGLIGVTLISGIELAYKRWQLRLKVREATQSLAAAAPQGAAYAENLQTAQPMPEPSMTPAPQQHPPIDPTNIAPAAEPAVEPTVEPPMPAPPSVDVEALVDDTPAEPALMPPPVPDLPLPPEVEAMLKQQEQGNSTPSTLGEGDNSGAGDKYYEL